MTTTASLAPGRPHAFWRSESAVLIYMAAGTVVIHWIAALYSPGFHRDELATLDDARHLAWGYVAYPPVTPFFARLSLTLFGTSLAGFRFFASLANAVALVMTGQMARDLGGRRGAQLLAAFAALPAGLAIGSMMQYVSFDYLAWVLVSFCIVRLLKTEDPRWWLGIGASVGFGMLSKYAMPFFVAGVVLGMLLTPARRYLRSRWFWLGVGLSLLIFLPNLIWQIHNDFVYLDFVRHIHARDVRIGRTKDFLPDRLKFTMFAAPLWIAGLWFSFFSAAGRRFRLLGWMYVTPLVIFLIAKGRGYYLVGAYPMLYAAGSVWGEQAGGVLEAELSESGRCRPGVRKSPSGASLVESRAAGAQERFSRRGTSGEALSFPGADLKLCARCRTAFVADTDAHQVSTDAGQSRFAESTGGTAGRSP
jgi:4-amino-4-deoxy-L-arabinose transferase-like glycosyltransferase